MLTRIFVVLILICEFSPIKASEEKLVEISEKFESDENCVEKLTEIGDGNEKNECECKKFNKIKIEVNF